MSSLAFSLLFISFLAAKVIVRFWLESRHIRFVLAHRNAVPSEFAEKIPLHAHQKAADYTVTKAKFGLLMSLVNVAVLMGFTLLGGLQALSTALQPLAGNGMLYQLALLAAFSIISGLIDLPFAYYKQFVMEAKFGFNKMTPGLFFSDQIKSALIGAATIIRT